MEEEEKKHPIQKLMDNLWLLLILGILVPLISYSGWGLLELLGLPEAILP